MRAPHRRRKQVRTIAAVPADVDLPTIAAQARYVGSPEHKDAPSFAGFPRPRADATICDRSFNSRRTEIDNWLREALRSGCVGAPWEGSFPRYVWYKDGNTVYEARLVNRTAGEYKGYALTADEWPDGVDESNE